MPINDELLAIIVCPACKGALTLSGDGAGLDCGQCELRYPIEDDIPVLLAAEAQPLVGAPNGKAEQTD